MEAKLGKGNVKLLEVAGNICVITCIIIIIIIFIIMIIVMIIIIIIIIIIISDVLRSLTVREESRLRVFENRILRRIFGPKRDENGKW